MRIFLAHLIEISSTEYMSVEDLKKLNKVREIEKMKPQTRI